MRYQEIDFARGVAVVLMLLYHFFFDASYFGKLTLSGDFWYFFPRFIGGMFIFISGFTTSVVYGSASNVFSRVARKTVKLAAIAAGITTATYIFAPREVVVFGIIHFFAAATIASLAFINRPGLCMSFGVMLFSLGLLLQQIRVHTSALVWLGVMPYGFATLDYYPFLPWFGVFLIGMFFGSYYRPIDKKMRGCGFIELLGRNSLKIYLIQHPIIVLVLQIIYGDILQMLVTSVVS